MRSRIVPAILRRIGSALSLGAAVAALVVLALQPAAGHATGLFRENLPSTLTAVSIGSPPSVYSVNFFGIAPLEIPDPDADPALSSWGYRYRVVAAGNLPDVQGTNFFSKLALWDSNSQVWRLSAPGANFPTSGTQTKFLQLWVNTKCPRMYIASFGPGAYYDSIDSSGKCSDADPTPSNPRQNLAQSMTGLDFGASLNAMGGAPFGSEVGNPTVFGGVVNELYKLDNLLSQPLWSSVCSLEFGSITRIAVGNYDPVNDTYTAIAVNGTNKVLRYTSSPSECSIVTVDADATVVLNDVSFVGSTATVIAVGNGGRRYVSTRAGAAPWTAVTEPAGQAYTNLGYSSAPDLIGVEAFAAGPTGRSAVLFGNRSSSSASNVTPVYRVEDVARPSALDSPSTDLFANLAAIGGIDPEHFWAVRNGTILRSFPGRVSGYNWFGPDATSTPNGFFAKLSCGTQGSCDSAGLNYGLNIESASSLQHSAIVGRAWVGLADGTAGASGGIRPALQEHTELTPGVLGQRIGVQNATTANRLDRTAVAGNYLYTGGHFDNGGTPQQRIERRQITSSGDSAGQLVPFSGTTTCASGTSDAVDNGYFQFGTPTVSGTDYLQVVSPLAAFNVRVRTVRADDADYCTHLKNPAPASVSTPSTPGCIRNANAADYGIADYTNTLYVVGGTCGGASSSTIYRSVVAPDGTPANSVLNATALWRTMTYPKAFVVRSPVGAAMVVYDPGSSLLGTTPQLGVAPINTAVDERCSGPVGTVCTFTVQANAVPVGIYNGASAYPTAVGVVGDYVLATYRSTDFDETPGAPDPRAAFRGRTVLAARIRLELLPGREVTTWFAAADRKPTNFPPLAMAGWSSGSRAVAYFGPILDDRGWWSVQRYDTEQFATSPGWLSFNYADNFDFETVPPPLQVPPASCIPFGSVTHPGLSRINQNKSSYTVTNPVSGCVATLYPDEAWGWGRFLNLKAEGERQNPRETDWGWVSLRGPTVSKPSSAVLQSSFRCFDCTGTAPGGTCAFCESNTPKLESNSQPTCSQCTGCDPITGICGAGGGSCTECYQYGVNLDPTSGGTFHGYAWSGGQTQSTAAVVGRIASYTCDGPGSDEQWWQSLLQSDPELNAATTYYQGTDSGGNPSCSDYWAKFQQMMSDNAASPFRLVVIQDPHLTSDRVCSNAHSNACALDADCGSGNTCITNTFTSKVARIAALESYIQNGGTVLISGEPEELNGATRSVFAGVPICQSDGGDPPGVGCGYCTQYATGACGTSGSTVSAGSHYPFDLVADDTIAKPPEPRYEGVILNSTAYGGTLVPAIDAPYTMSGTPVGTVGEIAHWGFGSGQVYYVSDESKANPPTSCSQAECKNSSVALTQAFFVNTIRNLAKDQSTGYGWISFEQGATGLTRFATFVQAQYGSIYSGGKISSTRGASPFTEFGLCNAFLVQSASDTITSLCADVTNKQLSTSNPQTNSSLGAFNPGLVTNATPVPFPKTENQFTSSVGPLDITGLTTVTKTVLSVDYNKYGNVVVVLTPQQFSDQFDGAGDVLGGKIYNLLDPGNAQENLTVTTPLVFKAGTATVSGAGLVVVNGTLRFAANVTYENVTLDKISQLASAGWIVNTGRGGPPDLTVESQVTDIAGSFFVRGMFRAITNGRTDAQLIVHGPALAHEFDLQRNAVGNPQSLFSGRYIGGAVGSEVFVDDGRLRLNPPPGFQNLRAALPIYR